MALDPSIILDINPQPIDPNTYAKVFQQAAQLREIRDQQQSQNMLRALAQQPGNIDPKTGSFTPNALAQITKVNPQLGMKLGEQAVQAQNVAAEAEVHKSQAFADKMKASHEVASEAVDTYDAALAGGASPDAARVQAQDVLTKGVDKLRKSGMFSDAELAQAQTEFDPVRTRANAGKTAEWLDRVEQAKKDALAEKKAEETERHQREVEAREERHERVQEGLEGARLKLEERKEAREERAASDKPNLSPLAIEGAAEQLLAGDRSVLQNFGRGKQGAADLAAVRNRTFELAAERGLKGADLANIDAAFRGQVSGEQALGRRGAQLEQAGSALEGMIGLSKEAYSKLPRGQFVPFNKLRAMVDHNLSSPEQAAAFQYDEAVVNAWAKSINPSGGLTVSDVKRGEEMLSKVTSVEAHNAVLDAMLKEVAKERGANVSARANLRDQGEKGPAPPPGKRLRYNPSTGELEPVK